MLAEAVEVERLAVDEEADVRLDVHRPDAVRQPVRVAHVAVGGEHVDLHRVHVAGHRAHVARPPQLRVGDGEAAAAARVGRHAAARDGVALRVAQRDEDGARADRRDEEVEVRLLRVEPRRHRDVLEVRVGRRRVQLHVPLQAGVVEKVHLQPLHAPTRRVDLDVAGRDRRRGQRVVDRDRDPVALAKVDHHRLELQVEGQVAALVLADKLAVDPRRRVVVGRADVQHDAPREPVQRHEHVALVPDHADQVAQRAVLADVVVRRRHRHQLARLGHALVPARRPAHRIRIGAEAPQPVEVLDLARLAVLRVEAGRRAAWRRRRRGSSARCCFGGCAGGRDEQQHRCWQWLSGWQPLLGPPQLRKWCRSRPRDARARG